MFSETGDSIASLIEKPKGLRFDRGLVDGFIQVFKFEYSRRLNE